MNEEKMSQINTRDFEDILKYFQLEHLSPDLQAVARPFTNIAYELFYKYSRYPVNNCGRTESLVCLRKLLEAKDCAVRAAL